MERTAFPQSGELGAQQRETRILAEPMPNLHKQLPKAKTPHERDQWPKQYKWLRKHVEKMYAVFKPPVEEYEAEQQA